MTVEKAVVLKHQDKPMICGGHPLTSDCYTYDLSNDRWDIEPSQLIPARYGAMSVEIRPGEYWVMGGTDGSNDLHDIELFKDGIFTPWSFLPDPIVDGSAVMLNSTHLFVAEAGPSDSPVNYLVNIDTDQWTRIADRGTPVLSNHVSGAFYDSSAGEVRIATIAHDIQIYSPRDDAWHYGPSFPQPIEYLYDSATVQEGQNSFLLFGGEEKSMIGHVLRFNDSTLQLIGQNVLNVARKNHIAIAMKDIPNCNGNY